MGVLLKMCLFHFLTYSVLGVCVPRGTCINPNSGKDIDLRIVTPGGPQSPTDCAPNVPEACKGVPFQCGKRYITDNTVNGPSKFGAFPWQAYLVHNNRYIGSGVLIDDQYVLTAAHKVDNITNSAFTVHLGVWNTPQFARNRTATAIRLYKEGDKRYNRADGNFFHDIALIKLNKKVPLGFQINIGTGCMPEKDRSFVGATGCVVAGWGQTDFNLNDAPTNPQKQVTLPIVSYQVCKTAMSDPSVLGTNVDKYLDPVGELCAGGQARIDACTQDGGAPLMCPNSNGNYVIAGLVLWGKGCGRPNVYGVYVAVSKYRDWIAKTIIDLNNG